jgi:PBP1b-binding outer membrane lipoprotein LpoB
VVTICHALFVSGCSSQIGLSQEVDMKLQLLREKVVQELRLQTELQRLQGMIEPMLAASLRSSTRQ